MASCEHCNGPWDSLRGGEDQRHKKNHALWTYNITNNVKSVFIVC